MKEETKNKWDMLERANTLLLELTGVVNEIAASVPDQLGGLGLTDLAALQAAIGNLEDGLSGAKTACTKFYDRIRLVAVPAKMDEEGISNVTISGVGRVTLVSDVYASIKSGKQEEAHLWLEDNGHGGLIKQTVNASTLKAFIKRAIKEGETFPEGLFNVTPFTRAQITKV